MKLVKVAPALALSALLLSGCNQGESVKLDNHIDQASYGVGLNIGRQIWLSNFTDSPWLHPLNNNALSANAGATLINFILSPMRTELRGCTLLQQRYNSYDNY